MGSDSIARDAVPRAGFVHVVKQQDFTLRNRVISPTLASEAAQLLSPSRCYSHANNNGNTNNNAERLMCSCRQFRLLALAEAFLSPAGIRSAQSHRKPDAIIVVLLLTDGS